MSAFDLPKPGETGEEMEARKEEMIRFMIHRHIWPRAKAIDELNKLDHVGLAYVGVEMRIGKTTKHQVEYDPFASSFSGGQ